MMSEKEILAAVGREITEARGYDADELQFNRRRALRYYFGRKRGDEQEGLSTIQSLDVADQVNSIMAQLSPMMKSTLVEFQASSEQDEDQAQLESDFVMHIADQSNAYHQFSNAAFDALLQANGWMKVWTEEPVRSWVDEYEDVDIMMLADYLAPTSPNDIVELLSKTDEDENGKVSCTIKHTVTEKLCRVEAIAPEYMLFAAGHLSSQVQDIRFIAEKQLLSKSELIESGISKAIVDKLPTVDYETFEAATERQFGYDDKRSGEEKSTYVVDVYDCHVLIDIDQDGIAELWRIRVAGYEASVFLSKELARFIPYCTGSALPLPHRLTGTSMYDLMKEIQDGKTQTLRQLVDNQRNSNQSRFGAVEGEVNMQDVLSSQVIRMRSPDALFPIPFTDIIPSCIMTMQYLDKVRTDRGGGALDMQQGDMQIAGSSATAAVHEYGAKERMSVYYCRNIVESLIKGTYALIHMTMRTYWDEDMQAKLHGKWAQTNPRSWPPRKNLSVVAGLSAAERREKANALAQNLQYQSMALQAGFDGVLVTPAKMHATLIDWLRSVDLGEVESFYVDPDSEEGQAAAKSKGEAQQAEKQAMEQLTQRVIDQEQQLDKYKHDTQLAYDRWEALLKSAIEEAKIAGQAVGAIELESIKQAGQVPGGQADAA
jgi:hypothetical protein